MVVSIDFVIIVPLHSFPFQRLPNATATNLMDDYYFLGRDQKAMMTRRSGIVVLEAVLFRREELLKTRRNPKI